MSVVRQERGPFLRHLGGCHTSLLVCHTSSSAFEQLGESPPRSSNSAIARSRGPGVTACFLVQLRTATPSSIKPSLHTLKFIQITDAFRTAMVLENRVSITDAHSARDLMATQPAIQQLMYVLRCFVFLMNALIENSRSDQQLEEFKGNYHPGHNSAFADTGYRRSTRETCRSTISASRTASGRGRTRSS